MSTDWRLIVRGFAISTAGAVASMLYIVGASAAFVGSYAAAIVSTAGACSLAIAFYRLLPPFLDILDRRTAEFSGSHDLAQHSELNGCGLTSTNGQTDSEMSTGIN